MSAKNYQIKEKAQYLNLLILKDDLEYSHELLSSSTEGIEGLLCKLRHTRQVFLVLGNVREAAKRINIQGSQAYIEQTRNIRKKLHFVNHFRNKATGHLDHTLLERAVQWSPNLFYDAFEGDNKLQTIGGYTVVVH